MIDDDTASIRMPSTADAISERIKLEVKRVKQADRWTGLMILLGIVAVVAGLVMVGIAAGRLTGETVMDQVRHTLNGLGLAVLIAGVVATCSGVATLSMRRHVHLAKLEQAAQAVGHRTDTGRLAAQLESVALLVGKIEGKVADLMPLLRDAYVAGLRDAGGGAVLAADDAFVDRLSEQEDGPKTNGHNVTKLIRPRSYDRDWPRRT